MSAAASLAALGLAAVAACRVATVRPLDDKVGAAGAASAATPPFDAAAFVDSIWRSEVLRSLDAARDVAEIAGGAPAADRRSPVVVRGRGRVTDVDTRSRSGTATVELDGTRAPVRLQVGPVLTGMAIRDALPVLGFDRFVNQLQHADVGNQLNERVERELLLSLDRKHLRGRHVSFAGMASVAENSLVTVTPVRLQVEP